MSACLDSWAILAWLDGEEPALSRVEQLLASRPIASWVNLVEVYYRVERDHGRGAADDEANPGPLSLGQGSQTAKWRGGRDDLRTLARPLSCWSPASCSRTVAGADRDALLRKLPWEDDRGPGATRA